MRLAIRVLLQVSLALLFTVGLVTAAYADDYETAPLDRQLNRSEAYRVRARVLGTPAGSRAGGFGFARIELINPTEKAHVVVVRLRPGYGMDQSCEFRKTQDVKPNSRVSFDMPLLNTQWGMTAHFTLDGRASQESVHLRTASRGRGARLAALFVGDGNHAAWSTYLQTETKRYARSVMDAPVRIAEQLPTRWTLLSGFDLIVVAYGAPGLSPERQQTLVRYVASGGSLAVTGMPSKSAGPLATMCQSTKDTSAIIQGRHGLGRWLATDGQPDPADAKSIQAWLQEGSIGTASIIERVTAAHAGGLPPALWLPLQIPGLGDVPRGLFFLLILLFVIFVGPLSYIYFRRKRRLAMLLVTIPLAGFLCTAFILGYGMFSEGFGIIGTARSFTVLDQASHVAAVASGRTLYAGIQPQSLDPSADSFVACASFAPANRHSSIATLQVDLDAGYRIAGGILPSRTPTPFVTNTVGRSRERLRFRRRPDGGFDVLATPGYAPIAQPGAVLLHTKDGGYYLSVAAGHLAPMPGAAEELAKRVSALANSISDMPMGSGDVVGNPYRSSGYRDRESMEALAAATMNLKQWITASVGTLRPGSYLARVAKPPLPEELGLDVTYRSEEHVVLGLLGPEDVIDE